MIDAIPEPRGPVVRIVQAKTGPFRRVRFGDHVAVRGYYAGLIVDIDESGDNAIVAHRENDGVVVEWPYKTNQLHTTRARK